MLPVLAASEKLSAETHIQRHGFFEITDGGGDVFWSLSFNNHLLMSIVATVIALLVLVLVAKKMQPRPEEGAKGYITRGGFGGFFEMILVYLRDETVRPLLHGRTDKYIGFLWSLFFFILFGNLIGMLPIGPVLGLAFGAKWSHVGGAFTGNWNFTIALSVIAAIVWLFAGLKEGGMGYIKHYWVVPLGDQPKALWPLLIVVGVGIALLEILGNVVIKPFALCVRLLANMMAGHMVLGSILIISVTAYGTEGGSKVGAVAAFLGALAISFLELFVAFLQAYIFMFLTAIFISLGMPHDDHGHEGEGAASH